jgi:hypothetical protein
MGERVNFLTLDYVEKQKNRLKKCVLDNRQAKIGGSRELGTGVRRQNNLKVKIENPKPKLKS